jgi:uncharacterized protein (TIGR00251 family)
VENIPFTRTRNGIRIEVKVEPRSSKKGLAGVLGNKLKVKLTSPPVDGEANEQLVEVLAEAFGIKKAAVKIIRGQSSKNKVVELTGISSLAPLDSRTP